jgi:hypothetical protein
MNASPRLYLSIGFQVSIPDSGAQPSSLLFLRALIPWRHRCGKTDMQGDPAFENRHVRIALRFVNFIVNTRELQ